VTKPAEIQSGSSTYDAGLLISHVNQDHNFIPLDPSYLTPDKVLEFAIYVYITERKRYVLFKVEDDPIKQYQLDILSKEGQRTVFVPRNHAPQLTRYLSEFLGTVINDNSVTLKEKSKRFHTLSVAVLKDLFESPPDMQQFTETMKNVSDALSVLVQRDLRAIKELNSLRSYDYNTYSHSLNVCVLSIGFYMDMTDRPSPFKVTDLSRGILLHDIGKLDVPSTLTKKPGPLSKSEWAIMRQHPVTGVERLNSVRGLSDDSMLITLYHHEAVDGSGYPEGIKNEKIPFTSRLCKVVDIYDALTSNRSYKERMTPYNALNIMIKEMGNQIDQDILRSFILFLEKMGKIQSDRLRF
jgi:HD-GYP domain-containing protein (c-di-GMP phosphodiesterase class II)